MALSLLQMKVKYSIKSRHAPPLRRRVRSLRSRGRIAGTSPPRWWRLISSLLFSGALVAIGATWYLARAPASTQAADQPNPTVSYQGKLSDANGNEVGDGMQSVVFSIYSAPSGGTALWTETWATTTSFQTSISAQAVTSSVSLTYNAPTTTDEANLYVYHTLYNVSRRDQVTVTAVDTGTNTITITPTSRTWESGDFITNKLVTFDGQFSVRLPATSTLESIFSVASSTRLYLGVNVNGDGEMQPRKQVAYAPFAINALYLGGVPSSSFARLDTANTFATTTFTGSPGGTAVNQGGLYINPSSPGANQTLLGVANNGSERFKVDAEGDVFASGTVSTLGITTTSTNPLLVYGGAAASYVQVGSAPPAAYRGFGATSSDDLFVADDLYVASDASFDGPVWASSTLQVTGAAELYGTLAVVGQGVFTATPSGSPVGSGTVYINPPSASTNYTLLGVAVNGVQAFRVDAEGDVLANSVSVGNGTISAGIFAGGQVIGNYGTATPDKADALLIARTKYSTLPANTAMISVYDTNTTDIPFLVDKEGDVFASGTLSVLGIKTTSTNPLLVYGGAAASYVQVGSSLPATYRGFSATSSDDLFVASDLFVDGAARFDGAVWASSTFQATSDAYLYGITTLNQLVVPDSGGGITVGAVTTDFNSWVNFNAAGYLNNWAKAPVAITAASADPLSFLLGAGTGGVEAFSVRAGGYVFASGTVTAMGLTTTSTDPLRVYGGASTGYVSIGSALPAAYRGFSATSSDDLLVGNDLFVDGAALFDGSIWASSTLQVTGASTFYATSTYDAAGIQVAGVDITNLGAAGSKVLLFADTSDWSPWLSFELNGSTPFIDSGSGYITFRDSIAFDSSGDTLIFGAGMTLGGGTNTDTLDLRDDQSTSAPGNFNFDVNQAFPIISAPNAATTTIYETLLVSSTDSFYIRSIVNNSNVAARMALDDTNDEFIIDVKTSTTAAGPLDVAVKLDDQAGGLSYFRVRSSTTAVWSVDSTGTVGAGGSDVAERYPSTELLLPGDVVAADPGNAGFVRRATGSPGESILGVVSTKPAIILGFYEAGDETLGYDVALVGRVPVRVTDENGPIAIGDLLTLGSEPGTAVRRTGGGPAIGTALEAMASSSGSVTAFINVTSQPDLLEVVPATARDASLKVYRFAPYAGIIEVANLIVTETIEVRGDVRVAGNLQLDGALLTEFWDASNGKLRVGDAAAIVGPGEVDATWANRTPPLPAVGLVAEVVPPERVSATATADYLALLAQRGRLVDPSQLRRLRVAVGGTLSGFTGLVPGTRYYLAEQPPYPAVATSSQEALVAEAPAVLGAFQQLLGIARDDRSLLLYVSPQYQVNEPPPVVITPAPNPIPPQPSPEPEPEPSPKPEPDQLEPDTPSTEQVVEEVTPP